MLLGIPFWYLLEGDRMLATTYYVAALALFAGVTDILDGYLARKLNQVSEWGKILDPLADKICVIVIAIQLYRFDRIDIILFFIIIGRDVLIVAASALLSNKIEKVLPSNYVGKASVLVISFYLLFIMLRLDQAHPQIEFYFYSLVIIMSVLSLLTYLERGIKVIRGKSK
jgi:CDP-diacylglycerol--glycerol-3-phosphate 3-phosphatidyltransferase